MLIATKLGRAVTYDDDLPPLVTKLFKHAVPWGHGTNHNYYLQYENVYGLKTSEGGYIPGEAPTHKYAWFFNEMILRGNLLCHHHPSIPSPSKPQDLLITWPNEVTWQFEKNYIFPFITYGYLIGREEVQYANTGVVADFLFTSWFWAKNSSGDHRTFHLHVCFFS